MGFWATLALLASPDARAESKAVCLSAASKGQTLRDAHKLIEARDQFRVCAQEQCPRVVARDCVGWLEAVEKGLPTVVLMAKERLGKDISDARVQVDGQALLARLDGQAVPVNPGLRTFRVELNDGTTAEQAVQVREGEKNQKVEIVLERPPPPVAATAPRGEEHPSGHAPAAGASLPASEGVAPWKTVGWVAGGVGVAGLAVGVVFGVMASGDKSSADCTKDGFCKAGPLSNARDAATLSDIGFVTGGVLLAGGVGLVLLAPSAHPREDAKRVKLAPWVAAGGAGLTVGGGF